MSRTYTLARFNPKFSNLYLIRILSLGLFVFLFYSFSNEIFTGFTTIGIPQMYHGYVLFIGILIFSYLLRFAMQPKKMQQMRTEVQIDAHQISLQNGNIQQEVITKGQIKKITISPYNMTSFHPVYRRTKAGDILRIEETAGKVTTLFIAIEDDVMHIQEELMQFAYPI